jgi:hypothetical protein
MQIERAGAARMKSHNFISTVFLLALGLQLALSSAIPAAAQTKQEKKAEAELRTLHGSVIDKDENPIASGVVYLMNAKTQEVRTYIADEQGNYRFSGLDPNVDYEIHAEHEGLTSSTRTLSSYDSRKDIEMTLKIIHPKKG